MRPPDRNARRSAKALAPMSISGPPGQAVVIFQLYDGPLVCAAAGSAARAAAVPAPAFRKSRFFMVSSSGVLRQDGAVDRHRCVRPSELLDHRLQLRLYVVLVIAVEDGAHQPAVQVAGAHEPVGDREGEV